MILPAMIETGKLLGALCALLGLAMTHRRTRRVTIATMRFAKRYAPRWLVPALTVCVFIAGPIDDLFVIAAVLFPILRSARNRRTFARYIRVAWSH